MEIPQFITWDSMDHVDPNDPDAKAWRRTHTRLHHKVDLHLIQRWCYPCFCHFRFWVLCTLTNILLVWLQWSCCIMLLSTQNSIQIRIDIVFHHREVKIKDFVPGPFCQSAFPAHTRACNQRGLKGGKEKHWEKQKQKKDFFRRVHNYVHLAWKRWLRGMALLRS